MKTKKTVTMNNRKDEINGGIGEEEEEQERRRRRRRVREGKQSRIRQTSELIANHSSNRLIVMKREHRAIESKTDPEKTRKQASEIERERERERKKKRKEDKERARTNLLSPFLQLEITSHCSSPVSGTIESQTKRLFRILHMKRRRKTEERKSKAEHQ